MFVVFLHSPIKYRWIARPNSQNNLFLLNRQQGYQPHNYSKQRRQPLKKCSSRSARVVLWAASSLRHRWCSSSNATLSLAAQVQPVNSLRRRSSCSLPKTWRRFSHPRSKSSSLLRALALHWVQKHRRRLRSMSIAKRRRIKRNRAPVKQKVTVAAHLTKKQTVMNLSSLGNLPRKSSRSNPRGRKLRFTISILKAITSFSQITLTIKNSWP